MWAANSTLAFLFSSFSFFSSPEPPSLIVETPFGKLEGTTSESRNGRTVYDFLGIRYALPPVALNRFKPPVPWNETWEGVRDANNANSKCVQYHLIGRFLTGDEDCLLNYNTKSRGNKSPEILEFRGPLDFVTKEGDDAISEEELKPVIVYFHGGIFMQGSAQFYKPKYFMDEDVVFVSIQYRLGALGFLNLEHEDIRGNMGLKDQVEGLKWVQKNIRSFGGDPNKVTIFGESAGSVAVHYHMISPLSRGLFHRAISQSGTALVPWGSVDRPFEQAKYFAEKLNCSSESKEDMAKCLRGLDANEIGFAQRGGASILHPRYALFAPTIEFSEDNDPGIFLGERPEKILKSGNFTKVPWICGANSEEGLIYAAPMIRNETIRQELSANWSHWIPILFRFEDEPNKEQVANEIREYYFGNLSSEMSLETLPNLTMFLTDRSFFEGLHHTLNLHRGQHPIYPYIYSYRGIFSFGSLSLGLSYNLPIVADVMISSSWNWISSKVLGNKRVDYGVAHGDELPLMFNLPFQKIHTEESEDYDMSITLIKTWVGFAKDGVPPDVKGITWPSLTKQVNDSDSIKFLRLDKEIEIVEEPFHSRVDFWKALNLPPYQTKHSENDVMHLPVTEVQ